MEDETSPLPSDAVLIPGLPNDVALQCLARVPRDGHPILSAVSWPWRSLLRSPLLFSTRSALRLSEPSLFLSLRLRRSLHWFSLRRRRLLPIPLPPLPFLTGSAAAALGPRIYLLGGSQGDVSFPAVSVYDPIRNRWGPGPRMRVGREFAAAAAVAGKLYCLGGCVVDSWARSVHWAEELDPASGSWAPVPSPFEVREKWMHASAVIGGRIYAMADRGGVVFDPNGAGWARVSTELDLGWRGRAAVVAGVLYCYDYLGKIRGYDVGEDRWKELKGVEKGLPKFLCGATMADFGGRLMVVWEGKERGNGKEMDVMCAEVEVRKDGDGELWGSIVWSGAVLSVPADSSIVHCLAVEL